MMMTKRQCPPRGEPIHPSEASCLRVEEDSVEGQNETAVVLMVTVPRNQTEICRLPGFRLSPQSCLHIGIQRQQPLLIYSIVAVH
jgi:hypothetical protein